MLALRGTLRVVIGEVDVEDKSAVSNIQDQTDTRIRQKLVLQLTTQSLSLYIHYT